MPTDRPADAEWTLLHGGALGDLIFTVQLALGFADVSAGSRIRLVSRTGLVIPSACTPIIVRERSEGVGLHWLHSDSLAPPSESLRRLFRGRRIVSAYGDATARVQARLRALEPAALFSLDPAARADDSRHITAQWRAALAAQGLQFSDSPAALCVPDTVRAAARQQLTATGGRKTCFIVHVGSGSAKKNWPIAGFIEVARALRASGAAVVALLGPAEVERLTGEETAQLRESANAVIANPDHATLALLLIGARAYIGHDSGPTHLAALLGTPVVALFGPTSPEVWRPLGRTVRVLSRAADGSASDWGIPAARVIDAVAEVAAET